jgi:Holliday junction resolvase
MSKSQRTKGASGERELARILTDALGTAVKRKLDAAREGGDDIAVGHFSLEVKRRAGIAALRYMDQARENAGIHQTPVVAMREDGNRRWVVMLDLGDFIPMMRDAL